MGDYKAGGKVDKCWALMENSMTWNLHCLWIMERLSGRRGGGLEIPEAQNSCWVCNFAYFMFWCPVEPIWIFVSRSSSEGILHTSLKDLDWANTGLLFFSSGNLIFLAFINYEFIQASTGCGFLPTQFPWGHFVHQMTCIAYWETQASAPIMLLIVFLLPWLWKSVGKTC